VQQLTIDLIAEFASLDRGKRRGLIADVLNLLSREDFEADEDEQDQTAVRQGEVPRTAG
jgi:hypothetical protein